MDFQESPSRNRITLIVQSLEKHIDELKKLIAEIEKEEASLDQTKTKSCDNQSNSKE